jgi:hypothetical protein
LRAIVFICEFQVFEWIVAANMRGVFPWTRDVAVHLRVKALALAGTNRPAQAAVSHWLDRPGGGEWNVRKWGQRFRRRWGLKYGRGIILTPMSPTEMERKACFFPASRFFNACVVQENVSESDPQKLRRQLFDVLTRRPKKGTGS